MAVVMAQDMDRPTARRFRRPVKTPARAPRAMLSILVTEDLHRDLTEIAQEMDRSISWVGRTFIQEGVAKAKAAR